MAKKKTADGYAWVSRDELFEILELCEGVRGSVRLELSNEHVRVRCAHKGLRFGFERSIVADGKMVSPSSATIPLDPLLAVLLSVRGKIGLQLTGDASDVLGHRSVVLRTDEGVTVEIATVERDEFEWPQIDPTKVTVACDRVPAEAELISQLQRLSRFVSRDEARLNLRNIQLTHDGEQCHIVATDGYRIAVSRRKWRWPSAARIDHVVDEPLELKFAPGVMTGLSDKLRSDQPLRILGDGARIVFQQGRTTTWGSLQPMTFPDWRAVVVDSHLDPAVRIGISKEMLLPFCRIVRDLETNVAGSKNQVVLRLDKDKLAMSGANTSDVSPQAVQALRCLGRPDGEWSSLPKIAISPRYLFDAVDMIQDPIVTVFWHSDLSILSVSNPDLTDLVATMPIRL
jgi:hypothetical protein